MVKGELRKSTLKKSNFSFFQRFHFYDFSVSNMIIQNTFGSFSCILHSAKTLSSEIL